MIKKKQTNLLQSYQRRTEETRSMNTKETLASRALQIQNHVLLFYDDIKEMKISVIKDSIAPPTCLVRSRLSTPKERDKTGFLGDFVE